MSNELMSRCIYVALTYVRRPMIPEPQEVRWCVYSVCKDDQNIVMYRLKNMYLDITNFKVSPHKLNNEAGMYYKRECLLKDNILPCCKLSPISFCPPKTMTQLINEAYKSNQQIKSKL